MKRGILAFGFVLLLFTTVWGKEDGTVVVLSVDALAASYLSDSSLPNIHRLMKEGAYAERLIPIFPSLTFPNHVTLATGCPAGKHGIVANKFVDSIRGEFNFSSDPAWMDCEPLWVSVERQKTRAGVSQWPLSFAAWRNTAATYHRDSYSGALTDHEEMNEMIDWLKLPKDKRPRLVMGYVPTVDHAGHSAGPDSAEVRKALEQVDQEIGYLVSEIEKLSDLGDFTFVLLSDHGMAEVRDSFPVTPYLSEHTVQGTPVVSGPILHLHLSDPKAQDQVADLFNQIPGVRAASALNFPVAWGPWNPRMGEVIALSPAPTVFTSGKAAGVEQVLLKGNHGFDPELPEMSAILIVWGSQVAAGARVARASSLDVAATISRFLDLEPPLQNEGRAIEGFFAPH